MKVSLKMACLLVVLSFQGLLRAQESYPVIDTTDLPGARFTQPKTYTGASLFGYMNGGAELYREYGCKGAWIGELTYQGGTFKIEIFKMTGPEEAFGIYSVSRYQCQSNPPLASYTCHTPYQLQLCKGPFYVNIIKSSPGKSDSLGALQIGAALAGRITEAPADMSTYFPEIPLAEINCEAILVKGELGIMNGAPDLAAFFSDLKGYRAVILESNGDTLMSIKFAAETDKTCFLERQQSDASGAGKEIKTISENHLLITLEK